MQIARSSNPALNKSTFTKYVVTDSAEVMTLEGTINKILLLFAILVAAAAYTWALYFKAADPVIGAENVMTWTLVGGIGGFVAALVTIFKKSWAGYSAPVYALLEGLFLGGISSIFEGQYPGIVIQAVGLTFGTLFTMLFLYKSKIIKVTNNFRMGVVAATGGIFIMYMLSFIMGLFGFNVGYIHSNGLMSIGISLVVVVVAALNLVLDFDFIENGASARAPKFMEWYAAFGLMVTLVWLYIEFLRLLSKLKSRN